MSCLTDSVVWCPYLQIHCCVMFTIFPSKLKTGDLPSFWEWEIDKLEVRVIPTLPVRSQPWGRCYVLTSGGVAALVAWSPEQTFCPPYAKWFCSPHLGFNPCFLTSEFTPEPLQEPGRLRGARSFPHTTLLLICTAVIAETKAAVRYCPPCQGGIHACKNHSRCAHWLWVVLAPGFDPALTACISSCSLLLQASVFSSNPKIWSRELRYIFLFSISLSLEIKLFSFVFLSLM